MARPLLFVALAGQGHVTPTLPLVAELVRRGHEVEYATSPAFAGPVGAAGARWVPLPDLPPFVPPPQVGPDAVAAWFRHFFAGLAATYPVLRDHVGAHRPRGVVYDTTNWPARLVARELGLPAVRTVPNLAENQHYTGVGDALVGRLTDHPTMLALVDDVARFADRHDVELDLAATLDVTESLNLVFVVMTIGEVDPDELGVLPATVQVGRWFPQLAVLRRASAFLTHAGMNSTVEAVHCGVPMLALPQMPEQVVNADRVVELGIGRRLDPGDLGALSLRRAVDDVVADRGIAAALDRLRDEARRDGGPPRAPTRSSATSPPGE